MTVTKIEPKRGGRSALYIDGVIVAWIYDEILAEYGVREGTELSPDEVDELAEASKAFMAKEKALNLLSYRDHSGGELRRKISRSCGEEAAKAAVERMEELGLVDDGRFAEAYARELAQRKHFPEKRVVYELARRGVDKETAVLAAQRFCADPTEHIIALINKKYLSKLSDPKGRRNTVAALQRMGYDYEDIKSALRSIEGAVGE